MTKHYLEQELIDLVKTDTSIFEFLQRGSLDGIWYWDLTDPEHEWMSDRFWMVLGYDPGKKKPLASEWQDLIFPDDLETAQANLEMHLKNPHHPYDQVVRYRHSTGLAVWIRCRGIAIRDPDTGKPLRMLGAHVDLTAQMQAQEKVNAMTYQVNALKMQIEALHIQLDLKQKKIDELLRGLQEGRAQESI